MTAVGYASTTGDARKVAKSGDTMTGELVLPDSSPDTALAAASKGYVDTGLATKAAAAHASTHTAAGSDPLTLTQAQITGLAAALAALAPLAGATFTGDVVVDGANLVVRRADDEGAYRFRVTGGALDLEIGGMDVIISVWAEGDFTGAQANIMRWEPAGPHMMGRTIFGTGGFDVVHALDAGTGVAEVGKKNGLANIRLAGFKDSAGAPGTGTWAAGDVVLDSAGAWHLCTTGGTPGVWT